MDNLIDEDIKLNVTKDSVLSLNEIIDDKTPEMVETAEIEATVTVTDEEISINDKELVNTEEEECTGKRIRRKQNENLYSNRIS